MRLFLFLAIGTQLILLMPELPGDASTLVQGAWVIVATALLGWQGLTYLKRRRHLLYARLGLPVAQADRSYLRRLFDGYADTYDQHLTGELAYAAPVMLFESLRPLIEGRRLVIADLGCGTGLCGPLFAPYARSLVGIDLSRRMLAQAQLRAVYHELVTDDLVAYLHGQPQRFEVCVAADVLVYMGELRPALAAVAHALMPGGYFAFTVETIAGRSWRLHSTGRYAHSAAYLTSLAGSLGFVVIECRPVAYRLQDGFPVPGAVWLMRKQCGETEIGLAQSVK